MQTEIIEGVDMIDSTPLLDIKLFYPEYDNQQNVKSDSRFDWKKARNSIAANDCEVPDY